ncbi:MAG: YggS family pyridoxal phosphate-dependent enzyme [Halobacteriovorax sp.]|nr:YggS family pyridoxal phosphate-dependent enzyme [Halobacteriovorax sp.]|tara:strand:+ start:117711 stop:118412 length:702 start_codon:yes stop_codon:yes gene_type:complete
MDRAELIKVRLDLVKRELGTTELVAVSKSTDIESIEYALESGQSDFGENRIGDLEEKAIFLKDRDITWHFIGHLQSNKINRLLKIPNLRFIHSIDSLKTLENLYKKEEHFNGDSLGFFLQINTSQEEEKQGFSISNYDELAAAANMISRMENSNFYLAGLMTMGKIRTEDFEKDARSCFKSLVKVRNTLKRDFELPPMKLSMGMSRDYIIAAEEGADYVRVGTNIFKPEEPHH